MNTEIQIATELYLLTHGLGTSPRLKAITDMSEIMTVKDALYSASIDQRTCWDWRHFPQPSIGCVWKIKLYKSTHSFKLIPLDIMTCIWTSPEAMIVCLFHNACRKWQRRIGEIPFSVVLSGFIYVFHRTESHEATGSIHIAIRSSRLEAEVSQERSASRLKSSVFEKFEITCQARNSSMKTSAIAQFSYCKEMKCGSMWAAESRWAAWDSTDGDASGSVSEVNVLSGISSSFSSPRSEPRLFLKWHRWEILPASIQK